MECGDGFELAMKTAGKRRPSSQGAYLLPAFVLEIQPDDVAHIEVNHRLGRSRSSDTIRVASVPPRSLWPFINLRNAGVSLRRAKYGVSAWPYSGTIRAIVLPR